MRATPSPSTRDHYTRGRTRATLTLAAAPQRPSPHLPANTRAPPSRRYERVLGGRVRYPPRMPPHAVDLISRLLERETSRRFGNLAAGAADVRRHPFYEHAEGGFTWAAAYSYRATIHAPSPVNADDFEWLPAAEAISDLRPCTELGGHLFARVFGYCTDC
jgi:hypothetical protein